MTTSTPPTSGERIALAIVRNEQDAEREGWDAHLRGKVEGLKEALAIMVGERRAVSMLAALREEEDA